MRGWAGRSWLVGALALGAVLCSSLGLPGCGSNGLYLDVIVVTDFLPALEVATIRMDVDGRNPGDAESFYSSRTTFVPSLDDDFVRGVGIGRANLPQHGHYTADIVLLDRDGASLARSHVEADIVDPGVVTVTITRNCVGVTCPGVGDRPEDTVCFGGRCVTPECAMDPAHCTDLPCTTDAQCSSPVACGVGECVRGACLVVGRPLGTPGACAQGRICDPSMGCRDAPTGTCESGTDGACALQEGVCAGAIVRCTAGIFPDCSSREYGARFQPDESLCDGLDNDCDGLTDEMDAPLCPLQLGVCAGATRPCAGSAGYLACDYAAHDFAYEPVEQTCDGLDNDCDGRVDESMSSLSCPLRDGVCTGSHPTCRSGSLACDDAGYGTDYEPSELTCDGLDNDCDRAVDEALVAPSCALRAGVCRGSVARCRGGAGWSTCGAAEYGAEYEPSETRCNGLDDDCDGRVDENITRACDVGCGPGTETCSAGVFVGCDAPSRTVLRNVTLAGGAYTFACLDVPAGAGVRFGAGTTLDVTGDASIAGVLAVDGAGGILTARRVVVTGTGTITAGELEIDVTEDITIDSGGLIDGTGHYSGGGGGGCSATSMLGVSAGGGGGSSGGSGGRGGGCDVIAGLLGGAGIGVGADGGIGCSCTCSVSTPGGGGIGGEGSVGCAGGGGGAGVGGAGGGGGAGAYPSMGWSGPGGAGGTVLVVSGPPGHGGAGGGGGGGQLGALGAGACAGLGGGGGARITLRADQVLNRGRIAVDGADGSGVLGWARFGPAGGGGGGSLVVEANLFDNLGIVTANGGSGGGASQQRNNQGCLDTSSGGGGGGGGGYVYLDVAALGTGSFSRISVGGGAGGPVECSMPPGTRGGSGIACCVGAISGCPACP